MGTLFEAFNVAVPDGNWQLINDYLPTAVQSATVVTCLLDLLSLAPDPECAAKLGLPHVALLASLREAGHLQRIYFYVIPDAFNGSLVFGDDPAADWTVKLAGDALAIIVRTFGARGTSEIKDLLVLPGLYWSPPGTKDVVDLVRERDCAVPLLQGKVRVAQQTLQLTFPKVPAGRTAPAAVVVTVSGPEILIGAKMEDKSVIKPASSISIPWQKSRGYDPGRATVEVSVFATGKGGPLQMLLIGQSLSSLNPFEKLPKGLERMSSVHRPAQLSFGPPIPLHGSSVSNDSSRYAISDRPEIHSQLEDNRSFIWRILLCPR